MKSYSQNNEDAIVIDYFSGYIGTLLEIGANDGITLSNSLAMIEQGWKAALIEPSPIVVPELWTRHLDNNDVEIYEFALSTETGKNILHESGPLLSESDKALVSSLSIYETKRWDSLKIKFDLVEVETLTFYDFMKKCKFKHFDFISIDAEGLDLKLLQQMDLMALGCKCICIEHNSNWKVLSQIKHYCFSHNLKQTICNNAENIILCR